MFRMERRHPEKWARKNYLYVDKVMESEPDAAQLSRPVTEVVPQEEYDKAVEKMKEQLRIEIESGEVYDVRQKLKP